MSLYLINIFFQETRTFFFIDNNLFFYYQRTCNQSDVQHPFLDAWNYFIKKGDKKNISTLEIIIIFHQFFMLYSYKCLSGAKSLKTCKKKVPAH
jgi:hypothetical protein